MKNHTSLKIISAIILFLSFLVFVPASKSEAANKVSYLLNTKKIYTYKYDSGEEFSLKLWNKENGYNQWVQVITDPNIIGDPMAFGEKETKKGLYLNGEKSLVYPLKKGKKWKAYNRTYTIQSTNRTIKTPAGTFKKVVEVRETIKGIKGYFTKYYAPNIGFILSEEKTQYTKNKVKIDQILIKLKNNNASTTNSF